MEDETLGLYENDVFLYDYEICSFYKIAQRTHTSQFHTIGKALVEIGFDDEQISSWLGDIYSNGRWNSKNQFRSFFPKTVVNFNNYALEIGCEIILLNDEADGFPERNYDWVRFDLFFHPNLNMFEVEKNYELDKFKCTEIDKLTGEEKDVEVIFSDENKTHLTLAREYNEWQKKIMLKLFHAGSHKGVVLTTNGYENEGFELDYLEFNKSKLYFLETYLIPKDEVRLIYPIKMYNVEILKDNLVYAYSKSFI